MDPGAIEAMIAAIGVQVANATAALVPVGVLPVYSSLRHRFADRQLQGGSGWTRTLG